MPTRPEATDQEHMRAALSLARRGLGSVWPNPAVGCVLVQDGTVVGRGWTQPGGRPHAETEALRRAGAAARGATAYVTLEPCAHHGQTPPCAEALIGAGVGRVVVAATDPDPRVAGRGLDLLRRAGIAVTTGVLEGEAADINAGFFSRIIHGRPLVTWKAATSLDGRIATHSGASQWITGESARKWGHRLRAEHDAIAVGIGTVLADDPALTCRLPGLEARSPVRVVFDSQARTPATAALVADAAQVPTWIIVGAHADKVRVTALEQAGIDVIRVESADDGKVDLAEALAQLGRRGITRLLVEGGAALAAGLLRRALVDRAVWFRAPMIIGGDGLAAAGAFGVDALDQAVRFRRLDVGSAGADMWDTLAVDADRGGEIT